MAQFAPFDARANVAHSAPLDAQVLGRLAAKREELLREGQELEAHLLREQKSAGTATQRKTIWQATGVHRGETEAELGRKRRQQELDNCRADLATLQSAAVAGLSQRSPLEQYGSVLNMISGGALGFVYGAGRGWFRGWWQDVTPSVCRELMSHVGRRTAVGTALLIGTFEAAPWIKRQALATFGREDVSSYKQEGALEQLWYVDAAYLAAVTLANFMFPYILLPTALNPMQLMIPPNDVDIPMAAGVAEK